MKNFSNWSIYLSLALIFTGGAWWYITQKQPIYSDNFNYNAQIISTDNFYDSAFASYTGEILSKTNYSFQAIKKEKDGLLIKNIFDVRKPSGEKIFSVSRLFGVNPTTGEHIGHLGDVNRRGYFFGPPNCQKQDFRYWHVNYDSAINMVFKRVDHLENHEFYVYSSKFKSDQTNSLGHLPGVPEVKGVELDVELTLWIDPFSGKMIKYEDRAITYFYDKKTRKRLLPWNKFHNHFDELSVSNKISEVKLLEENKMWVHNLIPSMFFTLGIIVLLIGFKFRERLLWRLYLTVAILASVGLTATYYIYNGLIRNQRSQSLSLFKKECQEIKEGLQNEINKSSQALYPIKSFIELNQDFREKEFYKFVSDLQELQSLDYPISYAPLVRKKDKENFENALKIRDIGPTFIYESNNDGQKLPVGDRDLYVPILYIVPFTKSISPIGFDLYSESLRRSAIRRAILTDEIAASGTIDLVQYKSKKNGLILALTITDDNLSGQNVKAFVTSPILYDKIFEKVILSKRISSGLGMKVIDRYKRTVYDLPLLGSENKDLVLRSSIQFANIKWDFYFKGGNAFTPTQTQTYENFVLIGGIILTTIVSLGALFLLTDDRRKMIATNERLESELREREKAEQKLIEIEHFAFIASHDLQQPLRTVSNYIEVLDDFIPENIKPEIAPYLSKISGATSRMKELIKDLLEYSRIGKEDNRTQIDCQLLIKNILSDLTTLIHEQKAVIEYNKLPVLTGYESGLSSVFQNLINNAID